MSPNPIWGTKTAKTIEENGAATATAILTTVWKHNRPINQFRVLVSAAPCPRKNTPASEICLNRLAEIAMISAATRAINPTKNTRRQKPTYAPSKLGLRHKAITENTPNTSDNAVLSFNNMGLSEAKVSTKTQAFLTLSEVLSQVDRSQRFVLLEFWPDVPCVLVFLCHRSNFR